MIRFAVVFGLSLLATSAFAGDDKDRKEVEVRYKAITELDLTGVELTAPVVKPNIGWINQLNHLEFDSLVKLRKDFKPEMRSSVAEVR